MRNEKAVKIFLDFLLFCVVSLSTLLIIMELNQFILRNGYDVLIDLVFNHYLLIVICFVFCVSFTFLIKKFLSTLKTVNNSVVFIISFILVLVVFNHLFSVRGLVYDQVQVPIMKPIGNDYLAVYKWTKTLTTGVDAYLNIWRDYFPIIMLINLPLSLFDFETAYRLFTLVLIGLIWFSIYYSLKQNTSWSEKNNIYVISTLLFVLFYFTYPIQFTIERGNCDTVALFFSVLSLYFVTKKKENISLVFLALAFNYKLYPLVLFSIIWLRFSLIKPFLKFTAINLVLLFILGPKVLLATLKDLFASVTEPYVWSGNHSLMSFFSGFPSYNPKLISVIISIVLCVIFLVLWFIHLRDKTRIKEGSFSVYEVGLIGMAFQLMCLLTSLSNDYKLVILISPIVMLLTYDVPNTNIQKLLFCIMGFAFGFIFSPRFDAILSVKALYILAVYATFVIYILYNKHTQNEVNHV